MHHIFTAMTFGAVGAIFTLFATRDVISGAVAYIVFGFLYLVLVLVHAIISGDHDG